ncbi:MAG: nucleotide exchange factor GrpE [Chloroflexi bacterium RBG_13_46_9]|jgi:molecular chaperone GrpE|nr:MAG: nucleotide exchange factor GrpE [Chloroflexi bacterium RBG_13_46_9]
MPEEQKEKPETPETTPEQELVEARKKADEYLDSWKRSQADFINYKRRAEQEKQEMGQYANAQLILSLLPVLDDFERAFDNAKPNIVKQGWVEGMRLIESKFRSILTALGLTQIEAVGKPFDPALHEAVMHVQGEEGIVVNELRHGYRLHDKVLRPSQVMVGNGETETPKKET